MDEHRITNEAQLRAVLGHPGERTQLKVSNQLDAFTRVFIERSPLVFVATADARGNMDVSPKGDPAGFVKVEDDRTLLIPERKGNRLLYGFRNLFENPKVGLVFVVPGAIETVRVNGRVEITKDPALLERLQAKGRPALLCTRVHVDECFFHCGKAFIRSEVWGSASPPQEVQSLMKRQLAGLMRVDPLELNAQIDGSYRNRLY